MSFVNAYQYICTGEPLCTGAVSDRNAAKRADFETQRVRSYFQRSTFSPRKREKVSPIRNE